eukprot:14006422-Heterocapsa_arctica.AAC.1
MVHTEPGACRQVASFHFLLGGLPLLLPVGENFVTPALVSEIHGLLFQLLLRLIGYFLRSPRRFQLGEPIGSFDGT